MMGQYRQWLHYREMDQQLRVRLGRIEQQAAELEEDIHRLADDSSAGAADNVIMRALVAMYTAPTQRQVVEEDTPVEPQYIVTPGEPAETEHSNGTSAEAPSWAATALFAQSYLTNFDAFDPTTLKSLSLDAETGLLPEDLSTFFATLTQNGASGQLPEANASLTSSHSTIPIDKQSLRNDRLIQRWFERWGQSSDDQELQQEGQRL
jgi:hypothetical protein